MTSKKIRTEAELRQYLKGKWFDCLIIIAPIILSEPIFVERPVDIWCSGVGSISYNRFGIDYYHGAFIVKSSGVVFRDPKINGDFYPGYDIHQSGIIFDCKTGHGKVIGGTIEGFNYMGVWQRDCDKVLIAGTTITGTGAEAGHNYNTWIGGVTDRPEMILRTIDCIMRGGRHAIGAHYGPNSYYAIGNTISTLKHSFDRHNWNNGGRKGGLHTHICGNKFEDSDRLAFSIEPPYEGGSFSFIGNTLNHSKERWIGEVSDEKVWEGKSPDWYTAHSNKFKMI